MKEYRTTLALEGMPSDEETTERLLGALVEIAGENGPVLDGPANGDRINVTLALEAFDAPSAVWTAALLVQRAQFVGDLTPGVIVGAETELVTADQAAAA